LGQQPRNRKRFVRSRCFAEGKIWFEKPAPFLGHSGLVLCVDGTSFPGTIRRYMHRALVAPEPTIGGFAGGASSCSVGEWAGGPSSGPAGPRPQGAGYSEYGWPAGFSVGGVARGQPGLAAAQQVTDLERCSRFETSRDGRENRALVSGGGRQRITLIYDVASVS